MKRRLFAILIAACALVACKRPPGQASVPGPAVNQDAIKALGSTVPETNYDHPYWLKQHDANTPEWQEAKRLCEQTALTNYPNCLPVNDIVQADQRMKVAQADKAVAKNDEMFRRGYQYDFARKECASLSPNANRRLHLHVSRCRAHDLAVSDRRRHSQRHSRHRIR